MLADQPYASVFGPASTAPYLSKTLEQRGELLVRYYAVAHEELANGIALLSGQGPTVETAANCPTYTDVAPATPSAPTDRSRGNGCVYPTSTQTLAGQLTAKHLSWRAYSEGMDEPGAGERRVLRIRCSGSQTRPPPQPPPAGQAYATLRNPFVYFHAVIDSPACATDDVGLRQLSCRPGRLRAHAELLLHRARPVPRRHPHAVRARRPRGAWPRPTDFCRRWFPRSLPRRPTRKAACS